MKNVADVLNHLLASPCFKKLNVFKEVSYFIQMMPPSLKNGIAFGYIKENTLFIALKHPCFKQEFYHKIPLIKQLLKKYKQEKNSLLEVEEVKYFVTHNLYKKEVEQHKAREIPLCYGELSSGTFENKATSKEIHAIFEEIRAIILRNL